MHGKCGCFEHHYVEVKKNIARIQNHGHYSRVIIRVVGKRREKYYEINDDERRVILYTFY